MKMLQNQRLLEQIKNSFSQMDDFLADASLSQKVVHLFGGNNRTETTIGSEEQANGLEKFGKSKALGVSSQRAFVAFAF